MFRSQAEKVSGTRKITLLPVNGIFFLPTTILVSIQVSDVYGLRKKEVIIAALNLFFMKTSISR
jgi:hypothetical protein